MRRMRLGDKSIERDAARLRALLGPGGGAVAGGNLTFTPALGGMTGGTTDRIWGGNPFDYDYVYGVDILSDGGGLALGCYGVASGTSSITFTPLLQLEARNNTGLVVELSNEAWGYSPTTGNLVDSATIHNIDVSPDGSGLKVATELSITVNVTVSKEVFVLEIYPDDTKTIEGCRILGWIIS